VRSAAQHKQVRYQVNVNEPLNRIDCDLGVLQVGDDVTTEIEVVNTTSRVLSYQRAGCRCSNLRVVSSATRISPNQSATLKVHLEPQRSGPLLEQLLFVDDEGVVRLRVDVTARVLASCEPDPGLLEIRVDPAYQRPDVVLGEFALVCREESLAPRGMEFCVEQPWVKCRRIAKEGDRVRYQLRLTDVPPVGEHELAWCSPRGQARRSFQPDLPVVRLRVVSPVRVEPAVLDLGIGRVGTDVVGRVSVGDSATSVTVRPGPGWDAQIASYCVERDGSGPPQVKVTLRSSQPVALEGMLDVEAEQPGGPLHRFRLQVLGACQ
jgi:hypothetical protein